MVNTKKAKGADDQAKGNLTEMKAKDKKTPGKTTDKAKPKGKIEGAKYLEELNEIMDQQTTPTTM
ncbi:hypothetical protein PV08_12102, partial [Exophiala spinifera]